MGREKRTVTLKSWPLAGHFSMWYTFWNRQIPSIDEATSLFANVRILIIRMSNEKKRKKNGLPTDLQGMLKIDKRLANFNAEQ